MEPPEDEPERERQPLLPRRPNAAKPREGLAGLIQPCFSLREWLRSSNNRSAACATGSAATCLTFYLTGHPHLAVKWSLGLMVASIFMGLPKSKIDQEEEDEIVQELEEEQDPGHEN